MIISTHPGTLTHTRSPEQTGRAPFAYPSTCVTGSLLGDLLPLQFPWQRFPQKRSSVDVMWSTAQWLLWGYQQWAEVGRGGGGGRRHMTHKSRHCASAGQKTTWRLLWRRFSLKSLRFLTWKSINKCPQPCYCAFRCEFASWRLCVTH